TKLFVQSLLPVNNAFGKFVFHTNRADQIREVNEKLFKVSDQHHFNFVNLHPSFCDASRNMHERFTNDGLHLTNEAYFLWKHLVFAQVNDLGKKPALIPQPKALKWGKGAFPMYACGSILITQKGLENESKELRSMLNAFGWEVDIKDKIK